MFGNDFFAKQTFRKMLGHRIFSGFNYSTIFQPMHVSDIVLELYLMNVNKNKIVISFLYRIHFFLETKIVTL